MLLASFTSILLIRPTPHADKLYKHGLRKRSKFFMHEGGRLFYIGGEKRKENEKLRLVVESADERRRIIISIHDQAHLGRDKTLSEIKSRYYTGLRCTMTSVHM